jgi:four helix bundle protein
MKRWRARQNTQSSVDEQTRQAARRDADEWAQDLHHPRSMSEEPTDLPGPFNLTRRTFVFARDVLTAYPKEARRDPPSYTVWLQLLDAACSVGANVEEAQAGSSRADFRAKIKIALREARESHYWLRLITAAGLAGKARVATLQQEARELVAILTTIARKVSD